MDLLQYLPSLMALCYIPYVCYSDIKYRKVNPLYFTPFLLIGIPCMYNYLLESPERNFILLQFSVVLCAVMFVLALLKAIGGADFIYASLIMLFIQFFPPRFPRVFFPLDFFWTLIILLAFMPIVAYFYNLYHKKALPFRQMFTIGGKFPGMILISLALVITMIIEVV